MFSLALILVVAVAAANIIPRQVPLGPPDGFSITQVNNNGNGCPGGSLNISITSDQMIVLSRLVDFNVSTGPNTTPRDKSKGCTVHASISYPGGWQFMLHQSRYSGHARLDSGVTGHFYTQYFVSSNAEYTVSSDNPLPSSSRQIAKYRSCSSQQQQTLLVMCSTEEVQSTV
jgi:hypothetical protein